MKKHLPLVASVTACILVVICLFQIYDLKTRLYNYENNLSNWFSNLNNNVNNVYSVIDNRLTEQASILAGGTWEFGEVNIAKKTVDISCRVAPKEYRADSTEAVLILNGKEYPMTLKNGEYTAELKLSLFEDSIISKVLFIDGGVTRTEALDWYITPRYDFLPGMITNFSGNSNGSKKDGIYTLKYNGEMEIYLQQKGENNSIKAISMLEFIDGKETARTDIPLSTTPAPKKGVSYSQPATPIDHSFVNYFYTFGSEAAFDVPFGSTLELFIEVTDSYGLRYRVIFEYLSLDEDGNQTEQSGHFWRGLETGIFDENGNSLWEIEW